MATANFLKRFNIEIDLSEAQQKFINRVENQIFEGFFQESIEEEVVRSEVLWLVAHELGELYDGDKWFDFYHEGDYLTCLHVLEISYAALKAHKDRAELSSRIILVLQSSEIDLGIRWKDGIFIPHGALILDEGLVNENLKWLSDAKYKDVYGPFERAINHYLGMSRKPELGFDVITDMYDALEALTSIVTGHPGKDLSANLEMFLKTINVSSGYKNILVEYLKYADSFRRGSLDTSARGPLKHSEVESFFYLTGLFIRLAVNNAAAPPALVEQP